jgi:hypothetical protein
MSVEQYERQNLTRPSPPHATLQWFGVIFAIVFPTISTWAYFVLSDRFSAGTQQAIYLVLKTIQFGFPLVWVLAVLRRPLRMSRPNSRGLALGAGFGIFVVGAGWVMFDTVLRDTTAIADATPRIHEKITQFGIDSVAKYTVLAVFYSLIHSLLEEYYWRCANSFPCGRPSWFRHSPLWDTMLLCWDNSSWKSHGWPGCSRPQ